MAAKVSRTCWRAFSRTVCGTGSDNALAMYSLSWRVGRLISSSRSIMQRGRYQNRGQERGRIVAVRITQRHRVKYDFRHNYLCRGHEPKVPFRVDIQQGGDTEEMERNS